MMSSGGYDVVMKVLKLTLQKNLIGWYKILLEIQRPISLLSNEGSMSLLPLFVAQYSNLKMV